MLTALAAGRPSVVAGYRYQCRSVGEPWGRGQAEALLRRRLQALHPRTTYRVTASPIARRSSPDVAAYLAVTAGDEWPSARETASRLPVPASPIVAYLALSLWKV